MENSLLGVGLDQWQALKRELSDAYAFGGGHPRRSGTMEEITPHIVILERLPAGRLQKMLVALHDGPDDEAWVSVATVFARADDVNPWHELARNRAIRLGAVSVDPETGLMWFGHLLQLQRLAAPWEEFYRAYDWIAATGDRLELEYGPVDQW